MLSFPVLLLGLGLGAACGVRGCVKGAIGPGTPTIIAIVALVNWTYIARIVRGQVLSLREQEFVQAARSLGASNTRILFTEILPNLLAPLIVYSSLLIPQNILLEAALSYLGVGVRAPTASWGQMLADATPIFNTAWWYMAFPGLALLLTVLAFNLLGDGLQDALNPRTDNAHMRRAQTDVTRPNRPGGPLAVLASTALFVLAVAGCGSGGSSTSTIPLKAGESPIGQQLTGKHRGGTLTVYEHEDFEHFDPGEAYGGQDYTVLYAIERPLYSYPPNTANKLVPDVAAAAPVISDGGKTLTVAIRPHIYFSPPVNREVNSGDVAYAIERGANPNVANPYFHSYFNDVVGAEKANGGPIAGIETPSRYTIVFHLTKPTAALLYGALSLPLSAPVPPEFAKPLDAHSPTTYGTEYLVATGPYMLKADSRGKFLGIGYQPGKSATLVRNPTWNPHTDYRPAYLDQIDINIGGEPTVIGQQVLKGQNVVQNDSPAQSIVKEAYERYPQQITFTSGSGDYYASLNNAHGPFTQHRPAQGRVGGAGSRGDRQGQGRPARRAADDALPLSRGRRL